MKRVWVRREHTEKVLVFFNGWSRDAGCVDLALPEDCDLLSCFDYTEPEKPEAALTRYREVTLVAWSLGVWAAAEHFENSGVRFSSALAVNGTLFPIDALRGIAPDVFAGTIDHWSEERARKKFMLRMSGVGVSLPLPERTPEDQRNELAALRERIVSRNAPRNCFDRALIGTNDRIFPPAAQRAAWEELGVKFSELPIPHYPLNGISCWKEMVDLGRE